MFCYLNWTSWSSFFLPCTWKQPQKLYWFYFSAVRFMIILSLVLYKSELKTNVMPGSFPSRQCWSLSVYWLIPSRLTLRPLTPSNPTNPAAGSVYVFGSQGSGCEHWQTATTFFLLKLLFCLFSEEEFNCRYAENTTEKRFQTWLDLLSET